MFFSFLYCCLCACIWLRLFHVYVLLEFFSNFFVTWRYTTKSTNFILKLVEKSKKYFRRYKNVLMAKIGYLISWMYFSKKDLGRFVEAVKKKLKKWKSDILVDICSYLERTFLVLFINKSYPFLLATDIVTHFNSIMLQLYVFHCFVHHNL